jgi:apolipoprotein N-acyltransferase
MKLWQGIVLAILVASISVLTACNALGIGKSNEQEAYEQRVKAYQQAIDANNKAQEEYYQSLQKGLEEYLKAYGDYQNKVYEQQLQQQGIPFSENQTQQ